MIGLFVCAVSLLLVSPTPAQADYNVPVTNAHVIVLQDGTCTSTLFGVWAYSTSSTNVYLYPKGQTTSACTFADIGVYPERAQVITDFQCWTTFGVATTTSATLTPQGRLTFTCKYIPQQV